MPVFIKHALRFWIFVQFEYYFGRFHTLPKEQALTILLVLISPFSARSGALIQSYASHPSESEASLTCVE